MEEHYTGFFVGVKLTKATKYLLLTHAVFFLDVSFANLLARLILFILHFHLTFLSISRPYKRDTERRNSTNFLL